MGHFPKGYRTFAQYNRYKQHVPWGDPLVAIRADVATLVTALGGNATVSAIYDIRLGVTATAGKVTQWDDARGNSGFGPSLVPFSTSPGPDYDAAALTASFAAAGVSGSLSSASTFSIFDPSAGKTLVYVGTNPSGSFIAGIGITAQNMNLGCEGTADMWAGVNGTVRSADSGVTAATRRIAFAAMVAGTLNVEVPNHIAVAGTAGAATSGNGNVTLGWHSPATGGGTGVARALLVLSSVYTTGQRDTLKTWAASSHAAVLG